MRRDDLADAAFACAGRIGLSAEDAWRLTGESIVTHIKLSKREKSKTSHRLSHQRKKAALSTEAERTEHIESVYGRRHFAYPTSYEFEEVFFRLALPYEIDQEQKGAVGDISLKSLQYRFIKHLIHSGIRGKSTALAAGLGTLLYRCTVAEIRQIYVDRAKSAYTSWNLAAVIKGEEEDDSELPKSDPTAPMRMAKNGMMRELLERFRHLTSPLLTADSLNDPSGFVEVLKSGKNAAAAALVERIISYDPHILDNFHAEPSQVQRLLVALNLVLENEQLSAEASFRKAVGNRKTPLVAPHQPKACLNRAAMEEALFGQIRPQFLAVQKIQEGREMRIKYLEHPERRMIAEAREFLGLLAPWGLACQSNALWSFVQSLRDVLGKTDPKGEAEADIHHAFVHPPCFEQLVEWFFTRRPEMLLPQFFHTSGSDVDEESVEGGGARSEMSNEFNSTPRMSDEERARLKDYIESELRHGGAATPQSLIVTVDGVEQEVVRLGSDSPGEKRYSFETGGSSELVQIWAPREDGRTLLAACLLREESETSRVNLKNGTIYFEVSYDGDYHITFTYLLKRPIWAGRKAASLGLSEFLFDRRTRYAMIGLITVAAIGTLFWLMRPDHSKVVTNTNIAATPSVPSASPAPITTQEVIVSATPPQSENSSVEDTSRTLTDAGIKLTADQKGNLSGQTIDSLPTQLRREVQAAWREGKLATPDLSALEGAEISVMGDRASDEPRFRLKSPIREVVRSQQPRFSWEALQGAESYSIIVSDADTYEVIETSGAVKTNYWKPKRALPRGRNYVWQVTALIKGNEVTMPTNGQHEAKFRVLDQSLNDELGLAESASPRSQLALGILYARAGLYRDARRELQSFVRANPNSERAARLLAIVNRKLAGK